MNKLVKFGAYFDEDEKAWTPSILFLCQGREFCFEATFGLETEEEAQRFVGLIAEVFFGQPGSIKEIKEEPVLKN